MSIAFRRIQLALRALGADAGPRERLVIACYKLVKLRTRDLPLEVAADFELLMGAVAHYPVRDAREEVRHRVAAFSAEQVEAGLAAIRRMHAVLLAYQPRRMPAATARRVSLVPRGTPGAPSSSAPASILS